MKSKITHVGFSDESHWNDGRFRSLGLVTLPIECLKSLEVGFRNCLQSSQLTELKWGRICGRNEICAAKIVCEFAIKKACAKQLRIDVLAWDIQDKRHNVRGRDDIANLQIMYYHIFRNVLRTRWTSEAVWKLYPDENTAIKWQTVQDCLKRAGKRPVGHQLFKDTLRHEFRLEEIQPVNSRQHPLLQLADLFAGMAVFSREKFDEYQQWLNNQSGQGKLFGNNNHTSSLSRSSRERFKILYEFDSICKDYKLGVSLRQKHGLWTADPKNPINFWMYEPQHPEDKAPVKQRR